MVIGPFVLLARYSRSGCQRPYKSSYTFYTTSLHQRCLSLLHIPPGSERVTVVQARERLRDIVGSPKQWGESRDPSIASITLPTSQSQLPIKRMLDSYREAVIPLGTDLALRGKYVNHFNRVRYGRIMEDLDTMAVWTGYTHNQDVRQGSSYKSPLSIVTAMVDSIDIRPGALVPDADIYLRGHVTWAGSTSLEISMHVEQEQDGSLHTAIDAKFLMVARDPQNKGKAFVCPLVVETEQEKAFFKAAEDNKAERQREAQESLLKMPPSEQERLVIHDLFLQTLDTKSATFKQPVCPANSVWMDRSLLKNIIICFPEERNLYHKIFGGFLMRQAYELAWANAFVYCGKRVRILAVDDIVFKKPVEIGSLLYLSSQVVYTKGKNLQIKVHAEVVDPSAGIHKTTNIFHYTFSTETDEDAPIVMPKTYAEYMMYLDGKRHYESAQKTNGLP